MEAVIKRHSFAKLTDWFRFLDPRLPVLFVLLSYLIFGLVFLGFNRSPLQAVTTSLTCMLLELVFSRLFLGAWKFPLSALITSVSLSFLLNYSHDYFLLFAPVFFAIGSKYLFTFKGKHALNPAMVGVSLSLLFTNELVTIAPAYQWNGWSAMGAYVLLMGVFFVVLKVDRKYLIASFLITFSLQTALRAWIMRHHLPFETLFLGTLSSPAFLIFTFFMITDPATSPADRKQQVITGILLALVDLALHLKQSYYTFFYAALIVGSGRLIFNHSLTMFRERNPWNYLKSRFFESGYYLRPIGLSAMAVVGVGTYGTVLRPVVLGTPPALRLEKVDNSGLETRPGDLLDRVDPRVSHVAKWILSNAEGMATADVNNDGLLDIFLTNALKSDSDRASLYLNKGNYNFEKLEFESLRGLRVHPEKNGVASNAVFVDYDNDGDQDLFVTVGFGHVKLLQNQFLPTKKLDFIDVSEKVGLNVYTNSLSASFADFNKDGLLDLFLMNVWPETFPEYSKPTAINIFDLPKEEYPGDKRMFNFMHDSWHMSNNGGLNYLFLQTKDHKFVKQDPMALGMPETRWSLAVGIADLNKDSWPDIYIANDFGPDDLYFHKGNSLSFYNHKGPIFGTIGKDTYKGMNVSVADFDRKGWLDVYVSNVHHAMQAEGSLFWSFTPGENRAIPKIEESATQKGVLNERRFGWAANAADLDLDGWVDLAQANGMVDDTYDKKFADCPDYWYVNEKVARSPPAIHKYANFWGDLRGYCIYGKEKHRIYLNRGRGSSPQFLDVASTLGLEEAESTRGVISADFTNSGRRDLLFSFPFKTPSLYANRAVAQGKDRKWVGFQLESKNPSCNREAVGTRVDLTVETQAGETWTISQEVQMVSGFLSQGDKRLHFGLGEDPKRVTASINWCYGVKKEVVALKSFNSYVKLSLDR